MAQGYGAYDALDAEMHDMDLSDFANTEFDGRGGIVSSAGYTPGVLSRGEADHASMANAGHTPGAGAMRGGGSPSTNTQRPKSVNWPDDPANIDDGGSGILVDTNEWGEWGSATPGITPGTNNQELAPPPQQQGGGRQPNAAAMRPGDAFANDTKGGDGEKGGFAIGNEDQRGQAPSPVATTGVPRGILSRAVSRAVQNTVSNRAGDQTISFDQTGFSDGAFSFEDMEVPAEETIGDQKYNNKYLEYRASQMNRQRAAPAKVQGGRHAPTNTIVGPDEVLPPVYSTKLLSQGIQQYELINKAVNLGNAIATDEKRKNAATFKRQVRVCQCVLCVCYAPLPSPLHPLLVANPLHPPSIP